MTPNLVKINQAIEYLFHKNLKISQASVAKKTNLHVASVRYHWTSELKKTVKQMNEVTRAHDPSVSHVTRWRYSTRLTKQRGEKKRSIQLNTLYVEDCLDTMKRMPDNLINLTLASPPYSKLRLYDGHHEFNFKAIAKQLYRVTKQGGVVVWVVGDAVVNGSETGDSFRQALYFMECNFKLHDTLIFQKNTSAFPARRNGNRYTQIFEYMFVFSKGKPKTVNLICDKINVWKGVKNWGKKTHRRKDGILIQTKDIPPVGETSPRNNIWKYNVGAGFISKNKSSHEHPAIFPEQLAIDHIQTWTNEGDLVYDCFSGSHTTIRMAKKLKRQFIGSEINNKYGKLWDGKRVTRNP